jgi:hypothetical protein
VYLEQSIAQQSARIAAAKQRQQMLQQQLDYVRSDAYVEEVARNELGMVQPGDELWVVVPGPKSMAVASEGVVSSAVVSPPLWQEWLRRLGW